MQDDVGSSGNQKTRLLRVGVTFFLVSLEEILNWGTILHLKRWEAEVFCSLM